MRSRGDKIDAYFVEPMPQKRLNWSTIWSMLIQQPD